MTFTLVLFLSLALLGLAIMQTCYVYACWRFLSKVPATWSIDRAEDDISNQHQRIDTNCPGALFKRSRSGIERIVSPGFQRRITPEIPIAYRRRLRRMIRHVEFVNDFFADKNLKPALHVIQHRHSPLQPQMFGRRWRPCIEMPIHVPITGFHRCRHHPRSVLAWRSGHTVDERSMSGQRPAIVGSHRRSNVWEVMFAKSGTPPPSFRWICTTFAWGGSLAIKRDVLINAICQNYGELLLRRHVVVDGSGITWIQVVRVPN